MDLATTFPSIPGSTTDAIGRHVESLGEYAYEYQLKLLHRMLLRNTQISVCADALNLSIDEVFKMRQDLLRRLRKEATRVDTAQHVGSSLAFYEEVKGTALRIANDAKAGYNAKVSELGAALEAQKDTIRFLQVTGLYDANPMKWNSDNTKKIQRGSILQEMAEAFLSGQDYLPAAVEEDDLGDDGVILIGGV